MKPRSRHRSLVLLVVAALVAVGVGAIVKAVDVGDDLELSTIHTRFDLRQTHDPRSDVVIVGMDAKTLRADPNVRFPFNRHRHARVIQQLTQAGASVIAYDLQFTEPSKFPDADEALIEAVRAAAPRVVLATTEVARDGSTRIFGGGEGLEYSRATPANSNVPVDPDGVLRHMSFRERQLETFPLAAARLHVGHAIKTPGGNRAWIDFAGPAGTIPQLSFGDVERGSFDADAVRGKVVVVGATAKAIGDVHAAGTGAAMSGPEIQASAIATTLGGFPLHDAGWVDWLLVIALGAVAPLVAMRFGTALALVAWVVAVGAFLVGAQLAFNAGVILAILPPLAAALTGLLGTVLVANPASHPLVNRVLDRLSRGEGMNRRSRRLRGTLLLVAALLVVTAGLVADAANLLRRPDLSTVNMRFDVRGSKPAPDVVIVAIEDKTLDQSRVRWPLDRRWHAQVIRHLTKAEAKVIAYDVQFTEESSTTKEDFAADNALIMAVRGAAPRVVLATTEVSRTGTTKIFGGGAGLKYSKGTPANSNYSNDVDGRIRRVAFRLQDLETFPLAAARKQLGHPVALPPGDTAWIDYPGPPGTIRYLSFGDVRKGNFDPAAVRGKVVVVGATAPSLQDRHSTSTSTNVLMPGPEIQAAATVTALDGFPLRSAPWWVDALLVVALGAIVPVLALRVRIAYALASGFAAIAALLVGVQLAFNDGTIVTVVYALAAGVAGILATAGIHGVTVAFERAHTREAFARFVPESVVDQVLADADGLRLGGVRGEATVMFSDLRGFTSFAETLEPEQVIAALNRYLTAMSEAILDHGGTLVAYMGDGIMAVFGAPLKQEDHADRALAAARDMLDQLEGFNQTLRDESLHDGFKMGIGLNTGAVMSGNVGSERRLEYTALGDTTNTAARLEGMTKGTPYQLYVSDSTRAALRAPADDLVEVGEFEVRGRKAKIKLWSLAEAEGDGPPAPADTEVEGATQPG